MIIILDHREKQLDYQGCFAITAGDNNSVRNIRFVNIRVEDFREGNTAVRRGPASRTFL